MLRVSAGRGRRLSAGLAALLGAVLAASCGRSSPTERGRLCRRYPTAMTVGGLSLTCGVSGCESGWGRRWAWAYRSHWDFVLEAQTPNRRLVLSQRFNWQGQWAWMGSGGSETEYQYDGDGQLVARRRTSWGGLAGTPSGRREVDRTDYDSWDHAGRPIAGTYRADDQEQHVTIWYDDPSRTMRSSIGELAVQDTDGNLVREVEVIGGRPSAREHVIQATDVACIEP